MSAATGPTNRLADSLPSDSRINAGHEHAGRECGTERLVSERANRSARRPGRGPGTTTLMRLLNDELSPRDLAILAELDRYRFLSTHHLETLLFTGHASAASAGRTARRVLSRLHRDQLIDKPLRRVGGRHAGSSVSVWTLTTPGKRLLNLHAGIGATGRVITPGDRRIDHYLAIADARVALVRAESEGLLTVHEVACEPDCWRAFLTPTGVRSILKPDLFAITSPADEPNAEDHWLIEADRGTEGTTVVLAKCRAYETYQATLDAHELMPLVIWIVPGPKRRALLVDTIRRARLHHDLYRVITLNQLVPLVATGNGGTL